ncbi:hypothetical protein H0H93_007214 [Arthromyces matolae]|nr:hypothetical protein H0H93_007214 [Arthromyces matolae]
MKEEKMRPSDFEVPDEGNWVKVEEAPTNVPTPMNHGEAAVLNEDVLKIGYEPICKVVCCSNN